MITFMFSGYLWTIQEIELEPESAASFSCESLSGRWCWLFAFCFEVQDATYSWFWGCTVDFHSFTAVIVKTLISCALCMMCPVNYILSYCSFIYRRGSCNISQFISPFIKFWLSCLKFEIVCKKKLISDLMLNKNVSGCLWDFPLSLEELLPSGGVWALHKR